MILQLIFKDRKLKTGKKYNLGITQSRVLLKIGKKYGQVTALLKFNFRPHGPLKAA